TVYLTHPAPAGHYTLSLHDALPICVTVKNSLIADGCTIGEGTVIENSSIGLRCRIGRNVTIRNSVIMGADQYESMDDMANNHRRDRKSTRLNSSHVKISYAVFCLKK